MKDITLDKLLDAPAEVVQMFSATASQNETDRNQAQANFAKAMELPLRQAVLWGDNVHNIYMPQDFTGGRTIEWPIDILTPGREDEFVAYTSPGIGRTAQKRVEADYVTCPTYPIKNSIQWPLRIAREANWPIAARALQVYAAGFVEKLNNEGWITILTAVYDRAVSVYDADAPSGMFTKRLLSLLKTLMTRNGGGNLSALGVGKVTDVFCSVETIEDVRNWNLDQVDDVSRREIYLSDDTGSSVTRVFGVNLHPMVEFGVGSKYQNFFINTLGGVVTPQTELLVALDLSKSDSFIMPVRKNLETYPDPYLHRSGEEGYYGDMEVGFMVADTRRCVAGMY